MRALRAKDHGHDRVQCERGSMKPKSFESSDPLAQFSPDPEIAEREFAELRNRLIKFFEWNGAADADDLADDTLFRVFRSLREGMAPSGSLQHYAHAIAAYVLKESRVIRKAEELPELAEAQENRESLGHAERTLLAQELLNTLSKEDRALLTSYFKHDRAATAARFGLTSTALRLKIHRILRKLSRVASEPR